MSAKQPGDEFRGFHFLRPAIGAVRAVLAIVAWGAAAGVASAQSYSRLDLGGALAVGGEAARYTRVLQLAGLAALTPWSIQPFTPSQARALRPTRGHPWAEQFPATVAGERASVGLLRPAARIIVNSSFPYQVSGGPTWAGRGLTADVQAGIEASWKAFSLQLAPVAFAAQNLAFPLVANGYTDKHRFGDARFPVQIDAPQRFGDRAYAHIMAGTSSLVMDSHHLVLGLSSAPQQWGPEREYPLVMGPNAGGFPSVFVGSSEPWNFWLFRGHARLVYGELGQSAYTGPDTGSGRRFGSGLVLVAEPRGAPGLEIGATRFLHRPWSHISAATLRRPFSGFLTSANSTSNEVVENQVASVFARWALPKARSEFYGEFYKEDYPGAFHQASGNLVEAPDDYSAFAFGFQHLLVASESVIRVMRAELVNGETSHQQRLERGFSTPLPPYLHDEEYQGHTLNGLILGSPEAYGGAGWTIGMDEFTRSGRKSVSLQRSLRLDWAPGVPRPAGMVHPDVLYSLRGETTRFAGTRELGLTLIPTLDLNRNLAAGHDVFNITAALSVRGW